MTRSRMMFAGVGVIGALLAPAAAQGDDPSRSTLNRSVKVDQVIRSASLEKGKSRSVKVRFSVEYPDAGSSRSTAEMRVSVFTTPARRTLVRDFDRTVDERRGEEVADSVRFGGRAARVLRRSGLDRRRTLQMVSLSSADHRDLDGDALPDHTDLESLALADVSGNAKPAPARAASLGGPEIKEFRINNQSPNPLRLTAAPLGCMYDDGTEGSNISTLNRDLASGDTVTTAIQNDKNLNSNPPDLYQLFGFGELSPGYADGLYNVAVKNLLFGVLNKYTSNVAEPVIYASALDTLPDRAAVNAPFVSCGVLENSSNFVLGADRYVNPGGGGAPGLTDSSAATIAQINGSEEIVNKTGTGFQSSGLYWEKITNESLTVFDQRFSPANCPPPGAAIDGRNWMGCRLPGAANSTKLTDLVIPGSHDSATGSAASDSTWLLEDKSTCTAYNLVESVAAGFVYNMAATQTQPMIDQLDSGIRYLDLRVAYDPGSPASDPGGFWRFVHTMFVQSSVRSEVQDIANWARAHPDEVVILDFSHVCHSDAVSLTEAEQYTKLVDDFHAVEPITSVRLCDVAYQLPQGKSLSDIPATTLGEMRSAGRNVLLLVNADIHDPACPIYQTEDDTANNGGGPPGAVPINHLWPEEEGPGFCPSGASDQAGPMSDITEYAYGRGPNSVNDKGVYRPGSAPTIDKYRSVTPTPFTQTQTQYTIQDTSTIASVIQNCLGSLVEYQLGTFGSNRAQMLDNWGSQSNIVIGDCVVCDDYITRLISYGPSGG